MCVSVAIVICEKCNVIVMEMVLCTGKRGERGQRCMYNNQPYFGLFFA